MKTLLMGFGMTVLASGVALPSLAATTNDLSDVNQEYSLFHDAFGSSDLEHGGKKKKSSKVKQVCAKVNASDAQKAAIMNAAFDYKQKAIQSKADMKSAKLKWLRAALDEQTTLATASEISSEAITAQTALVQAKSDLVNNIVFEILNDDQRKPALKCLAAMKKAKKSKGHHHHHHSHHGS